jgi:hypothetical protein
MCKQGLFGTNRLANTSIILGLRGSFATGEIHQVQAMAAM